MLHTNSRAFSTPLAAQQRSDAQLIRRDWEILFACIMLAFTFPLFAAVALAIKCEDGGPVLDRQPCVRSDGRRFYKLKFRTTTHEPTGLRCPWKLTRVGHVLRYTRIENLPALIDLLRGETTAAVVLAQSGRGLVVRVRNYSLFRLPGIGRLKGWSRAVPSGDAVTR